MAYTALEKMRIRNQERFGKDIGPFQPPEGDLDRDDLDSAAMRFLHRRCEELRFDPAAEAEEEATGVLKGNGVKANQVPYNMQMDVDRLCLAGELNAFIESGIADDAYGVYYSFLEMFFERYGKPRKVVELLSEYESNGSSLLMKHRDHFSHSVYVFALGLAIYETNEHYRRAFKTFYGLDPDDGNREQDRAAAHLFLEYWGLTALFHDIGYPFELPFEQVLSYFEVRKQARNQGCPFMAYRNLENLIRMDGNTAGQLEKVYGKRFSNILELYACDITRKLGDLYGFTEEELLDVLYRKPTNPEQFNYFIDHAFFSATRLYREMAGDGSREWIPDRMHIDALTAILLHNSLFKFSMLGYKSDHLRQPLPMDRHPLAWLLMLCDELQCWDRTAYGRNSRTELHPMSVDFDFAGNRLHARYYYDIEEKEKILSFEEEYRKWKEDGEKRKAPRLKAYSDMADQGRSFAGDIRQIVDTAMVPLTVESGMAKPDRLKKHIYLSTSNFLHIYDFAVALNGRYAHAGNEENVSQEQLEQEFEMLSLEYKLSNLNQVKSFGRYLNYIHCFYTDKPVAYEMLKSFTQEEIDRFAPLEHERWILERIGHGWRYGTDYLTLPVPEGEEEETWRRNLREQIRRHHLMIDGAPDREAIRAHYRQLPASEQGKDWIPYQSLLALLKKFDGLRIYRLDLDED